MIPSPRNWLQPSVVEAETKDHANWELIGRVAEKSAGDKKTVLTEACNQVEEEEDMHLFHTMGWARELWIESLGMPAVLPPPEEEKKVVTPIGASRRAVPRRHALMPQGSLAKLRRWVHDHLLSLTLFSIVCRFLGRPALFPVPART